LKFWGFDHYRGPAPLSSERTSGFPDCLLEIQVGSDRQARPALMPELGRSAKNGLPEIQATLVMPR
jgi:hypothetical protein